MHGQPDGTGSEVLDGSIRSRLIQGCSELRHMGLGEEERLACARKTRLVFRQHQKELGGASVTVAGGPDIGVSAADLAGVLTELGIFLSPTEVAYLVERCTTRCRPGSRSSPGGRDEATVWAGDLLAFFEELLSRGGE
ncbi:unnamed protein product [Discosporangium mesarthrocarpum]